MKQRLYTTPPRPSAPCRLGWTPSPSPLSPVKKRNPFRKINQSFTNWTLTNNNNNTIMAHSTFATTFVVSTPFHAEEDRVRLTHGSVRVDLSGKIPKFSLHNPLGKKVDLIFFNKTGLLLSEYLLEAFYVVKKLNDGTMATPATNAEGTPTDEPPAPKYYYIKSSLPLAPIPRWKLACTSTCTRNAPMSGSRISI